MRTQPELAWAAGAVDGEGCIAIVAVKHKDSVRLQYGLYIAVGNTDPRMPRRLADLFGGNVLVKSARPGNRTMYEWRIFASKAGAVLKELRPYLIVKGEQADVGIAFAETLRRRGSWHTADLRDTRESMRTKIAVLKREEAS